MGVLSDQLAGIAALSQPQLRAEWRRQHKGQRLPDGLGRDLATRALAWAVQERVHGGMSPTTRRALARFARQLEQEGDIDLGQDLRLKPGTLLVRQWHGRRYHVRVVEDGFQFDDRHYRSLTPIARAITGAAWSGPRFFGLKPQKARNGTSG